MATVRHSHHDLRGALEWCSSGELEENAPFWYSYDVGSAHFVVISSEHSLKHGGDQWQWLAAHLPTVDRCKTPWLILAIHRPLYVIHPHHSNRKVRPLLPNCAARP